MKLLITLLVTLGISMGSYGIDGNRLLAGCESDLKDYAHGLCVGYVIGFVESQDFIDEAGTPLYPSCVPDGVKWGQLRKVIVKFLKERPEKLHFKAGALVRVSLMKAFPCKD